MTFKDLKKKYSSIDIAKDCEDRIIIGDFFIREEGEITISRCGSAYRGEYFSIFTTICKNISVKQMEQFIEMIKEN
jgi:hypothetical protein